MGRAKTPAELRSLANLQQFTKEEAEAMQHLWNELDDDGQGWVSQERMAEQLPKSTLLGWKISESDTHRVLQFVHNTNLDSQEIVWDDFLTAISSWLRDRKIALAQRPSPNQYPQYFDLKRRKQLLKLFSRLDWEGIGQVPRARFYLQAAEILILFKYQYDREREHSLQTFLTKTGGRSVRSIHSLTYEELLKELDIWKKDRDSLEVLFPDPDLYVPIGM